MATIKLATQSQALLYELELKGQISDGYWENSKPHDHYRIPCAAHVVIDPVEQGVDFYPSRKYNFAAPQIIEWLGARMQMYILMSKKFPSLSKDSLHHCDSGEWIWTQKVGEELPEWKKHFIDEMKKVCNVSNSTEMQMVLNSLDTSVYTIKDLRKDLRAIKKAFEQQI